MRLLILVGMVGAASTLVSLAQGRPAKTAVGGADATGVDGFALRDGRQIYLSPDLAFLAQSPGADSVGIDIALDDGGTGEPGIRGFHFVVQFPADLVEVVSIESGSLLSAYEHYLDWSIGEAGTLILDGAVLGATMGISGSGILAVMTLSAVSPLPDDACEPIAFDAEACILRDPQNNDLTAIYTGGMLSYDITAPLVPLLESPTHAPGVVSQANDLKLAWAATVDEGTCPVGVAGYYVLLDHDPAGAPDPQGGYDLFVPWSADSTHHAWWFLDLADGEWFAHLAVYDSLGNGSEISHLGPLLIDTVAPDNVAGLDADITANADLSVDLVWSNPSSDFAGVQLYRKGFGNYPEYDDPPDPGGVPAWPASPAEALGQGWELVYDGAGEAYTDQPVARDYYYYAAFAYDAALNFAASSAQAQDASLSYWLGDFVTGQYHVVDIYDVLILSLAYNTSAGHPAYDPICDIGPTVGYGRKGRPTTDNQIEFDDLIVLANNYENAALWAPASEEAGSPGDGEPGTMAARLLLCPHPGGQVEARVYLLGNPGTMVGASIKLEHADDWLFLSATAGELWQSAGEHFFYGSPGHDGHVWMDAAVWNGTVAQDGLHAVARFQAPDPPAIYDPVCLEAGIRIVSVRARDRQNRELAGHSAPMDVDPSEPHDPSTPPNPHGDPEESGSLAHSCSLAAPTVFIHGADIQYVLAQGADMTLAVHDLNGRFLRMLFSGPREAGQYQVRWDGHSQTGHRAPPGIYFIRLQLESREANRQHAIRKIIRLR